MIRKIFTWAPVGVASLMFIIIMTSFNVHGNIIMDQPDPITKDGAISATWVLVGLAGCVVSLLCTIFLFAWRVIQMQGVTLNKTTTMQKDMQLRMRVLEDICLPSHLSKKGNAEKMARILQDSNQ